ncbi:MAG TPA: imidazoleglycerol-phosphate dehydratase HisB [Anaerolineae bacterium]|nr:imidazoleglycerol-phosphate dehydratase HisB [Anaerolineae bacterium]HOQ97219.1 imidazoleglycerol-phosphate dehydratase HisB [Anaerolineae bacterium]
MDRRSEANRQTEETTINIRINLDGSGQHKVSTGVPFLDHMLDQVAVHGMMDLVILAQGDVHIDDHHTVEDVGIVLGQALRKALGQRKGLARYGSATIPMDEALVMVAVDLSGRSYLAYKVTYPQANIGHFDVQLIEEFLRALVTNAQITLHVRLLAGRNAHHIAEAIFKALGRALYDAVGLDLRRIGIPSSKGALE